ncbi:hypothetical protein DVS28_b0447 (plasmid) [Euzebya pacifica]|uniref:DUF6884 domain-containing protein n=1 Tax=Euzebya pacifica TaxID=1608957 RepID=A0A346Y6U0_9ACTN|nr:hypothetical protein DVS28_b0447 [Euzebya pacifica]
MSPLFTGRRAWAERHCDTWYVVSALHGLIHPNDIISPYDVTLIGASAAEKRRWASRVLGQFRDRHPSGSGTVEFHAGGDYRAHGLAAGLAADGWIVDNPTEGMGIGTQLAFYAAAR